MSRRKFLVGTIVITLIMVLGCESQEFTSAKMYVQQNNLEKAEEYFKLALQAESDMNNALVPYLYAKDVLAKQRRWEEMNTMLEEALRRNPDQVYNDFAISDLATNLREIEWANEYKKGADLFNQVIATLTGDEISPDQRAKLEAARDRFFNATLIHPKEGTAYTNLVYCYVQLGDREGAYEALSVALAKDPENGIVLAVAGDLAREDGEIEKALDYYERAHRLVPDNEQIMQKLTSLYIQEGRATDALRVLENVLEYSSQDPDMYYNIGALYINIGNTSLESGQKKYLNAVGGDKIIYDDLEAAIVGFSQAKDAFSEAQFNLENALDLNPYDVAASDAIKQIQNLQKRLSLMMGSAEKVLEQRN